MKHLRILAALVTLIVVCSPAVLSAETKGEFILFLAGSEAGRETYSYADAVLETNGTIAVGAQTLTVASELKGKGGVWRQYSAAFLPGAALKADFSPGKVRFEVGPLQREYPLARDYVVLENNVFAHYLQLLQLGLTEGERRALPIVVPSLVLANQNPILEGSLEHRGRVLYQSAGETFYLQELLLTLPGNLQVLLAGDDDRNLFLLEIPLQGVRVVDSDFADLTSLSGKSASIPHWISEDFTVEKEGIVLAGTLALPTQGAPPFAAVFLNSGSGPQDRDGNTPPVYMADMFKTMMEHFTAAGFAVLAYDERGVGASSGDYAAASLNDLLSDVEALLDFLAGHPLVDPNRLAMLGHSEGALFAPVFADRLSALILLAGPSIPLDELLPEQLRYQLAQEWLSAEEKEILNELLAQVEQVLQEAREGQEKSAILPLNLDWLREHMELDPKSNLAAIKDQPVLIIQGEEDLKVMPYHAQELADALRGAGNENVAVHYLEGTTHEFGFSVFDPQFDPLDPLRINPRLFDLITDWLGENL